MASIPTIKICGPDCDSMIINESDLKDWRKKGYKPIDEVEPEVTQDDGEGQEKAIEDMTIPELREYAEGNDIDISGLTRRADIIEAIKEAESEQDEETEQEQE